MLTILRPGTFVGRACRATVAVMAIAAACATGFAQTITPRRIATEGPLLHLYNPQPTWESTVAAGQNHIVTLFNLGPRQGTSPGTQVGFSVATLNGSTWSWTRDGVTGVPTGYFRAIYPQIAYDPVSGRFLLVCLLDESGGGTTGRPAFSSFDPGASPPQTPRWNPIKSNGEFVATGDKPWIAVGQTASGATEVYVTYHQKSGGNIYYLRTADGGANWKGGVAADDAYEGTGQPGLFATCAVSGTQPLFVAYRSNSGPIRFIRGDDQPDGTY